MAMNMSEERACGKLNGQLKILHELGLGVERHEFQHLNNSAERCAKNNIPQAISIVKATPAILNDRTALS